MYAWRGSLGPNESAWVGVASAGRVFRRRWASIAAETRRDPRSPANPPHRRAAKSCSVRVIGFAFHPSVGTARKEEGREPQRVQPGCDEATEAGGVPPAGANQPAPQSKPVTHASRLVTHNTPSVASEPGVRILAAAPAHLLTVLRSRAFACADLKSPARAPSPPASSFGRSRRACCSDRFRCHQQVARCRRFASTAGLSCFCAIANGVGDARRQRRVRSQSPSSGDRWHRLKTRRPERCRLRQGPETPGPSMPAIRDPPQIASEPPQTGYRRPPSACWRAG